MAFSSCFSHSIISLKIDRSGQTIRSLPNIGKDNKLSFSLKNSYSELFGPRVTTVGADFRSHWSFLQGSRITLLPKCSTFVVRQNASGVYASWFTNSQIASSVFSVGTVAVLPFYTLMVLAPKANLTRKSMESTIPYIVLGVLYAYVLHLSWTPDTLRFMFGNKYLLPEFPGMVKLFSSEMTLASAWIHLLAVDLFAARQVFQDGLQNEIETRHSVSLCLFFCPIGILVHVITKALTKSVRRTRHGM